MRYATTFSGIGGWEIGLNACGWNLAWQCEREPYCRTLLAERFGVPICRDIRHLVRWLEGMRLRGFDIAVDVLVGSPPCQPFSVAGAQRGTADPRHLFPVFLGVVCYLRPTWILMEQVPAILSAEQGKAFEGYVGGLAALGYDLLWHCVPACAVGANHRRDRLWIVAHADHGTGGTQFGEQQGSRPEIARGGGTDGADASRRVRQRRALGTTGHAPFLGDDVAHPECSKRGPEHQTRRQVQREDRLQQGEEGSTRPGSRREDVADASGSRHRAWKSETGGTLRHEARRPEPERLGGQVAGIERDDAHATRKLQHRGRDTRTQGRDEPPDVRQNVSDASSLHGADQLGDEPGGILPSDGVTRVLDYERWIESVPGWWLVEPDVGRVAHGIPHRVDRLKGLGNAVIPQIPFLIGQTINAFLRSRLP